MKYVTNLERDMKKMYTNQFWALHPFSRDAEGIWEFNQWMWFTPEEWQQACDEV